MEDLKNKELIKVMWLPNQAEVLFKMKDETSLPIKSALYPHILQYIDIVKWRKEYAQKYNDWLNKDDDSIYQIENGINMRMIDSLIEVNKALRHEKIFYWFDIDRTYNDHFLWKYCPISKKELVKLGEEFPKINSLISPNYPLVFPLG
ncbi:hypothetical protein DC498_25740 [Terrimonas sp.]|uniref:hypothetical protein n=1 Tax=Terrimonas sp. TaxID=1914338 RepID=UPI000D514F8D|nr:hypothetical protein [Terrimonas sp.]PVD49298.1 hypothetical protein DC498_25740 [Terrimonas sp.]